MGLLMVILRRKKYLLTLIIGFIVIFGLSYYLTVATVTGKSLSSYAYMSGWAFTIISLSLSILFSLFFALYISLFLFKRDMIKASISKKKSAVSVGGLFSGLIASGCPTCGALLLGWLGFPLGLLALPFRGLELKLLSILAIYGAIYFLHKEIVNKLTSSTCKI